MSLLVNKLSREAVNLDVPLFSGQWDERGEPRLIRPTKGIAEGSIAEEEDRSGEAAAVPVARKKWNNEVNASLSAMPAEIMLNLINFCPDSARIFYLVSRELNRAAKDFLQVNRSEIMGLCTRENSPLYSLIRDRMTTFSIRLSSLPNRFDVQFHLSIPEAVRLLGVPAADCPNNILSATEISRFNDEARRLQDTSLQTVWGFIHRQILQGHPQPGEIPLANAPAEEIRSWMPTHQPLLQIITDLDMRQGNLACMPLETGLCTGLQRFVSHQNPVRTLPEGLFQRLGDLRYINFWSNQLVSLHEGLCQGLGNLRGLSFYNNQLQSLPERIFQGLNQLEELSLGSNQLGSLPVGLFQGLTQLQRLYLNDNQLRSLPVGLFDGLANLQLLHLQGNHLYSLPERVFWGRNRLSELIFYNNPLSSLPRELFQGLGQLGGLLLRPFNPHLLLVWLDEDPCNYAYHDITLPERMRDFFNYRCQTPLSELYQCAAAGDSLDTIKAAFYRLEDTMKNTLYRRVWMEAGQPITEDAQWGEHHAFDDMQIFNRALKGYARGRYDALDIEQKNGVYEHARRLAQSEGEARDGGSVVFYSMNLRCHVNVLRLIDATLL